MKTRYIILCLAALFTMSCNYLDVVPDNIATLDMAFNTRANAEKYLATCYNYVPIMGHWAQNSGLVSGGEVWYLKERSAAYYNNLTSFSIARGMQNADDPYLNYWSGSDGAWNMWRGIHECNIFLANIDAVPDLPAWEKNQWRAEVQVLKAYYHYWLMLHYGPIPLLKENRSVDSSLDDMMMERESIQAVADYCAGLIDEAMTGSSLPLVVESEMDDLGHITSVVAAAIKAKILVLAASPLFNGNEQAKSLVNAAGESLINPTPDPQRWVKAAQACKDAIDLAHQAGFKLYDFDVRLNYDEPEELHEELTLRCTVTERWNSEIIWALGNNYTDQLQSLMAPHLTTWSMGNNMSLSKGQLSPTLAVAERFYSEHGVPIEEDTEYDYANRYQMTVTPDDPLRFCDAGYPTVKLHLNREPRFYAYIGFDGGRWFDSETDNASCSNITQFKTKRGDPMGVSDELYSPTGYYLKKLFSWRNCCTSSSRVRYTYTFPIIRLADLYLMYAEALNQTKDAPDDEVYEYIQKVRTKDGLDRETGSLVETWARYSKNPNKPKTKAGMTEIIQRERLIELLFEGWTYHDIRRWMLGDKYLATPVQGWSVLESSSEFYYERRTIFNRKFMPRDYFWPIKKEDLYKNSKLVQNPLW